MVTTNILGLSAYYHDSAACLLQDGRVAAAAQEERFSREKHDASFPGAAVEYCLSEAGLGIDDLDYVGFYDKPLLKFERILETYLAVAPRGLRQFVKAGPVWIKEKLFLDREIRRNLEWDGPLLYSEHHESHAASAFYPSPFDEAAIVTMDGVGEWATASIATGKGSEIELSRELHWPDSLGLLYSAFTYYTGFRVNSGEYKVMGLAPYGEPRYVDPILEELMDLRDDGSFRLNQEYFNYLAGLTMTSEAFHELFGGPPRQPESELTQREMDLARSVQEVCEEVMLRMVRHAHRETGLDNLCLAGGVALNCVGNGRILREGPFEDVWIQPAAGDAGGALGVAELIWQRECGGSEPRPAGSARDGMSGAYLGPSFTSDQIEDVLQGFGARYERMETEALISRAASLLAEGRVLGWFQGRMEFGPRALGARSILGDPRDPEMQRRINRKIKFRESFRPFAPTVLEERVDDYFDLDRPSPYMLLVAPVAEEHRLDPEEGENLAGGFDRLDRVRSDIPAVTHVDCSSRIQTVCRDDHRRYYDLIKEFEGLTGCGVVVNTSFNVRGEPIVCTPVDAYRCFMRTHMDVLALGDYLLLKENQPEWKEEREQWREKIPLD